MYTISQVSSMLGIPAVTLRAWEHRYQAIRPVRTDTGYRVYTEGDIEDLRWLKRQVEERGIAIGQAVLLLKNRQQDRLTVVETMGERQGGVEDVYGRTLDRLLEALSAFRSEQAKSIMDLGFSMYGYENMIDHIISPLLLRTGDLWEERQLSVAQEHYITQFMMQRCLSFFQLFPIDGRLPKALAFCPSGEQHQMGLLLFSLFLRQKGVDVLFLGADTPEDGINDVIREAKISWVLLSFTDVGLCGDVMDRMDSMRAEFPDLSFAVGGQGAYALKAPYAGDVLQGGTVSKWNEWYVNRFSSQWASTARA